MDVRFIVELPEACEVNEPSSAQLLEHGLAAVGALLPVLTIALRLSAPAHSERHATRSCRRAAVSLSSSLLDKLEITLGKKSMGVSGALSLTHSPQSVWVRVMIVSAYDVCFSDLQPMSGRPSPNADAC